jgi:hypothetical protein
LFLEDSEIDYLQRWIEVTEEKLEKLRGLMLQSGTPGTLAPPLYTRVGSTHGRIEAMNRDLSIKRRRLQELTRTRPSS